VLLTVRLVFLRVELEFHNILLYVQKLKRSKRNCLTSRDSAL
jgi:hypothetical protein